MIKIDRDSQVSVEASPLTSGAVTITLGHDGEFIIYIHPNTRYRIDVGVLADSKLSSATVARENK